jgi:hypothetical protein
MTSDHQQWANGVNYQPFLLYYGQKFSSTMTSLVPHSSSPFLKRQNMQAQKTHQNHQAIHPGGPQTPLGRLGLGGSPFHQHRYMQGGRWIPGFRLGSTQGFFFMIERRSTIRFSEGRTPRRTPFSSKLYLLWERMWYFSIVSLSFRRLLVFKAILPIIKENKGHALVQLNNNV